MNSFDHRSDSAPGNDPATVAADWLVARDRGFTDSEEGKFAQWLNSSPRHREAWAEAEQAWRRLDRIGDFSSADLFRKPVPARKRLRRLLWALPLAAAAAVVIGGIFYLNRPLPSPAAVRSGVVRISPQRLTLSDGSEVELNAGSEITEQFTPLERRVRLVRGEAHFAVTKNSARPFIVEAGGVAVRAVGTAFNVRLDSAAVDVLVTEGRVRVNPSVARTAETGARSAEETASAAPENFSSHTELPELVAGQRALVARPTSAGDRVALPPEIVSVTADEITRSLSWQAMRLRFQNMPLVDVAAEFNRYNRTRLVVADDAAGVLVAGTFRADNVDVFVQFLESGFHVAAERRGDGALVLRRAP